MKPTKYHREIGGVSVDVYDVLVAFNVTCPATQHAIKKLLAPGQRGHKSTMEDLGEAGQAIDRAMQIEIARSAAQSASTAPQAHSTPADTRQPTPGLYEAPTRSLRRGYERTPE